MHQLVLGRYALGDVHISNSGSDNGGEGVLEVIYKTILGGFLGFDHEMINEMDHDE